MTKLKLKRQTVKAVVIHAVFLIVVYILQAEAFSRIKILGIVPALLPLATVGVAMLEGNGRGSVFGLFAGILCDISFNQPAALMTITLTLAGWFAGRLAETVVRRGFLAYIVVGLGVLLLVSFVQMFGQLFFEHVPAGALLLTALGQTLITLVFTIPMYPVIKSMAKKTSAA